MILSPPAQIIAWNWSGLAIMADVPVDVNVSNTVTTIGAGLAQSSGSDALPVWLPRAWPPVSMAHGLAFSLTGCNSDAARHWKKMWYNSPMTELRAIASVASKQ